MSDCTNGKTPKQLGLTICTSDITCYDGTGLECIVLPSNPDLNDVIESTDAAICSIINLINAGGLTVPNDAWAELDLSDMSAGNYTGTAGGALIDYNSSLFFTYKVIAEDTVIVRCRMTLDSVPITGINDFVQFNFTTPDIIGSSSNWFSVDKKFTMAKIDNTTTTHVPVSIIATDGTGNQYVSKGRATAGNNIFFVGFCQPNIANGTYNFEIDFELTCRLIDA